MQRLKLKQNTDIALKLNKKELCLNIIKQYLKIEFN